jgi:hypothetical protein
MGAATTNLPTAAAALKALDLPGATAAMRTECAGRVACTGWNNSLRFTPRSVGMAANLTKTRRLGVDLGVRRRYPASVGGGTPRRRRVQRRSHLLTHP